MGTTMVGSVAAQGGESRSSPGQTRPAGASVLLGRLGRFQWRHRLALAVVALLVVFTQGVTMVLGHQARARQAELRTANELVQAVDWAAFSAGRLQNANPALHEQARLQLSEASQWITALTGIDGTVPTSPALGVRAPAHPLGPTGSAVGATPRPGSEHSLTSELSQFQAAARRLVDSRGPIDPGDADVAAMLVAFNSDSPLANALSRELDRLENRVADNDRLLQDAGLVSHAGLLAALAGLGLLVLRPLTRDVRDEARRLTAAESDLRAVADQQDFDNRLYEGFEMVDGEADALRVMGRALAQAVPGAMADVMLTDPAGGELAAVEAGRVAPTAACPVRDASDCVAIRRGGAVVFESSEDINACPKLAGRPYGTLSAACVPVVFMGRALGVVHVATAEGAPPVTAQVERLVSVATQGGNRIGTLRVFEGTRRMASTDGLTGLANRRAVETTAAALTATATAYAVVLADLDHFKALNDTHGHEAGDRALVHFAAVANAAVRSGDVVGRLGGEEFVFLLPRLDATGATEVAERVRAALGTSPGDGPAFTASFGVAASEPGADLLAVLRVADAALYRAKREGRDRVVVGGRPSPAPPPSLVPDTPAELDDLGDPGDLDGLDDRGGTPQVAVAQQSLVQLAGG